LESVVLGGGCRFELETLVHQAAIAKREQHEDLAAMLTPLVFVGCGVWIGVLSLANVRQRAEEIGILRAIGWRSWQIMGLFLGKAVILGLMGAVLGYVTGFAVTSAFAGGALDQSLLFDRQLLIMTLLLAPLLSALASWIPALTAARSDPAVILQGN
jgi:ABC-type antimicrobial peptide transport system permease subunit